MPVNEVEALLFSAGKNMNVDNIATIIGVDKKTVVNDLNILKNRYNSNEGALMIIDEGDNWKIHVREQYLPLVRKIVADTELPHAVLETLAIIAFRSPVLQSEVIDARSSGAYEHISLLQELNFVTKEKKGRSFELKVTEKFFEYFDVEGDTDMKTLLNSMKKSHEAKSEIHIDQTKIEDTAPAKPETGDIKEEVKNPEDDGPEQSDDNLTDEDSKSGQADDNPGSQSQAEEAQQENTRNVLDDVENEIEEIVEHKKKLAKEFSGEQDDSEMS